MANLNAGAALREIGALFGEGTVAGQTDGQLLDRFLARRDPLAFEVLVERHGPMVLAVCRGTLCNRDDLEDAFQATFLVLVRKAGSIRGRDSIGPWLHRVAHRVAARANVESRRRREQERRAGAVLEVASDRGPREDLRAALHEEIDRLPERLRRPLVLCHLEATTHSQAAAELQMGEATVRRRLAGARDLLRSRLGRRGFVPAAVAIAAESASGAVPASWTSIAVRAAMAATFPGGIISPAASALSRRVARTIVVARLSRYAAAAVILTCALPAVVAVGARTAEQRPKPKPAKAVPTAAQGLEFHGKVVGPGEAMPAGARVMIAMPSSSHFGDSRTTVVADTTTGRDGRFRLEIPADRLEEPAADPGYRSAQLIATAEGLGPAWVALDKARDRDVTLRLVADVPLRGRVLDTQGRPAAGARVSIDTTATVKGGDLGAFLHTVRDGTEDGNGRLIEDRWWGPFPNLRGSTTTDADGKFVFSGLVS